jgi:hypothetical protein
MRPWGPAWRPPSLLGIPPTPSTYATAKPACGSRATTRLSVASRHREHSPKATAGSRVRVCLDAALQFGALPCRSGCRCSCLTERGCFVGGDDRLAPRRSSRGFVRSAPEDPHAQCVLDCASATRLAGGVRIRGLTVAVVSRRRRTPRACWLSPRSAAASARSLRDCGARECGDQTLRVGAVLRAGRRRRRTRIASKRRAARPAPPHARRRRRRPERALPRECIARR